MSIGLMETDLWPLRRRSLVDRTEDIVEHRLPALLEGVGLLGRQTVRREPQVDLPIRCRHARLVDSHTEEGVVEVLHRRAKVLGRIDDLDPAQANNPLFS